MQPAEERASERPQMPRGDGQRVLVADDDQALLTQALTRGRYGLPSATRHALVNAR